MESQPQNPEFRINPEIRSNLENFQPCKYQYHVSWLLNFIFEIKH